MEISVIIPVFNAFKYLEQCISSLKSFENNNCEIIFIDDCSSDDSCIIIQKYMQANHNAILLQNSKNMGPSFSRNKGIKNAHGNYIIFVDSDDLVSSTYYDNIIKHSEKWDFLIFRDTTHIKDLNNNGNSISFSNMDFLSFYSYPSKSLGVQMDGPWAKVFKKNIILRNNLLFDENIRNGEDILFNLEYSLLCEYQIVIDYTCSYFFRRDEYIKNGKPHPNIDFELFKFFEAYEKLLKDRKLGINYYLQFYYNIIDGYIYQIFERKIFNIYFKKTIRQQLIEIKKLFKNNHVCKAISTIKSKMYINNKKKLLVFLLKRHCYLLVTIILRIKYYK